MSERIIVVLIWLALATPCQAQQTAAQYVSPTQGTSIEELQRTALAKNGELQAAREALGQAQARLIQAKLRPNPSLEVSRTTDVLFANEGDDAFSVTYSQPFELGGKRSKRINVEEISIELTKLQIADAERQLAGRLRALFVQAVTAASRLDLFDRMDRLNQQMTTTMEVRVRSGDASRLDSQLLAVQTNQLRAQRLIAENQLAATVLQIRRAAGLTPSDPLVLKGQQMPEFQGSEADAISQALELRPDLQAARLKEQLEEAGIVLAKAQAVPNAAAFVRYGRESTAALISGGAVRSFTRENVMEFGISVQLPLFNREQGNVAEAASRSVQARKEREALEATIRQDVSIAYRRYEGAKRTLEILQTGVLQPNRDSLQIIQLAYNLGDMRLLDIVNQQRIAIEAETSYLDIQNEFNSALAELELATSSARMP